MSRKKITAPIIENWVNLTEDERTEAIKNRPRWYQENIDAKVLRQVFFDFVKSTLTREQYDLVRAGTPFITDLDGAIAHCLVDGYDHGPFIQRLLGKRIPAIISYVRDDQKRKADLDILLGREPKGEVKTFTIQERIAEQTRNIIGHIEGEIDAFVADGCKKSKFNIDSFLVHHDVKSPQAKLIVEFLDRNIEEIKLLLERKDEQLIEAYSFLTKSKQKKFYDFLCLMKDATLDRIDKVKKTRKKRNRKLKSPQQQVSALKYLVNTEDGSLKSIDPANIIGASQVWVYDVKTRFLFEYNSPVGMSVKGSTLQDFDADVSCAKKVRDQYADRITTEVMTGGKVKLRRIMPDIVAKQKEVTGRINKNQIILRVIR